MSHELTLVNEVLVYVMVQAGMYGIYVMGRHADAMPRQYLCTDSGRKRRAYLSQRLRG